MLKYRLKCQCVCECVLYLVSCVALHTVNYCEACLTVTSCLGHGVFWGHTHTHKWMHILLYLARFSISKSEERYQCISLFALHKSVYDYHLLDLCLYCDERQPRRSNHKCQQTVFIFYCWCDIAHLWLPWNGPNRITCCLQSSRAFRFCCLYVWLPHCPEEPPTGQNENRLRKPVMGKPQIMSRS